MNREFGCYLHMMSRTDLEVSQLDLGIPGSPEVDLDL
jgi:hypothetical protein